MSKTCWDKRSNVFENLFLLLSVSAAGLLVDLPVELLSFPVAVAGFAALAAPLQISGFVAVTAADLRWGRDLGLESGLPGGLSRRPETKELSQHVLWREVIFNWAKAGQPNRWIFSPVDKLQNVVLG